MRVWRICKAEHVATAFTGEGAMLYAGRWHHPGTPVVYCSESRALAALEQLVHLHRNRLPPNFVCFAVGISEGLAIREVRLEELPAEWRRQPGPPELRDIGTRWAQAGETVVLQVPSAVVPGEHNFLLNPRHPDFGRLAIGDPEHFAFDERLVGPGPGSQRTYSPLDASTRTNRTSYQPRSSVSCWRAHLGQFSRASKHLICEDRKRAAQERLEVLLFEGLDSGAAQPWTEADVEAIRAAARRRLKKRRGAHGAARRVERRPRANVDQAPS